MKTICFNHIRNHLEAISSLSQLQSSIEDSGELLASSLKLGYKILLCGNGGSAADAQHLAAELVGRFVTERKGLAAIALTTDTSILTAVANDYGYDQIFSRQVEALGREGDVLVAISTSGNSANVLAAVKAAKKAGCHTIGLAGGDGGKLREIVDMHIIIPVAQTAHVQECHIVIGHMWCALIDATLTSTRTSSIY